MASNDWEEVSGCCEQQGVGAELHEANERSELPAEVVLASLGCGNPTAVADLRVGETVLELGSGGGIDVLLSTLKGYIEDVPLDEASVDVVISNCVINLSTDKPKVLREMFRVLRSGGRIGISRRGVGGRAERGRAGRARVVRRMHRRCPVVQRVSS